MPPSVLLAYFAAKNAGGQRTLLDELIGLASFIAGEIDDAASLNRLLYVENPRCGDDKLTDRWPKDDADQRVFAAELVNFARHLDGMRNASLDDQRRTLVALFGEAPGDGAVKDLRAAHDAANRHAGPLTRAGGGLVFGAGASLPSGVRAAPRHTNYGDPL